MNAAVISALVAHANTLGLEPSDLDDAVYDLAGDDAARENNEAADDSRDDERHETHGRTASQINNEGLEAQIGALIEGLGEDGARTKLDEISRDR